MKWLKFIMLILCINTAVAQSPNYDGGNEDGAGIGILTVGTPFALYQGGNGDGDATGQLGQPTVFDMFRGGGADGFAWHDGNSPLQVNIYAGQTGDGFAIGVLAPSASFNMYNGGANDGNAASALITGLACNLYNGGNNDGFAWHDGNSPLQVNIYSGGTNDGTAQAYQTALSAFNYYAGGINDGVGIGKLTPATSFSFYNGGVRDGFAMGKSNQCISIGSITGNFTAITTSTAQFNWSGRNNGAAYAVRLYISGSNTLLHTYSGFTTTSTINSVSITGLTPGVQYCVNVEEMCSPGNSSGISSQLCFTTTSASACAAPTNQAIWFTSGQYLMVKWASPLYGNNSKGYQIAGGMNIASPAEATTFDSQGYYISQNPAYPSYPFYTGNAPGFTWFVRDICGVGDTSSWTGPYIVGGAKTNETTTGLNNEGKADVHFRIYPNPNNGELLFVEGTNVDVQSRLMIYNMQGELMCNKQLVLDGNYLGNLSVGVYLIRIVNANGTEHNTRLVIQH
ncbi:MAG: T9SS type A sorting domain-containing protein [Chitinophagales bacterium]